MSTNPDEVTVVKRRYNSWHEAYEHWAMGLDTEPPLAGAFFGAWLVRDAEIDALRAESERLRAALEQIRRYCTEHADRGMRGDWDGLADLVAEVLGRDKKGLA